MRIIESPSVDLIEPFPTSEARRVYGWLHCYRNIIESDLSPKTAEDYEAYIAQILPFTRSFGVIDKFNRLNLSHEAPLVGMILFEPNTVWNYYIHIASTRRAWGSGFMDEAIPAALTDLFESTPALLRVSAWVLTNNAPVKGLACRLGFRSEGLMRDMVTQGGEPRSLIHYGLTRVDWMRPAVPEPTTEPADTADTPTTPNEGTVGE